MWIKRFPVTGWYRDRSENGSRDSTWATVDEYGIVFVGNYQTAFDYWNTALGGLVVDNVYEWRRLGTYI